MNILQLAAFALVVSLILVLLRRSSPGLSTVLAVAGSAVLLTAVISRLPPLLDFLQGLSARAGVNQLYVRTLFRVIGIAYITDFAAQLCSDAGEGALAANLKLAGKVLILAVSIPVIVAVVDVILGLLDRVAVP